MKVSNRDALDVILFIGSILALGLCILAAGSMAIIAGVNNFLETPESSRAAWSVATIFTAIALLTIPGLYLSYRAISGRRALIGESVPAASLSIGLAFPVALALGVLSRQLNILPFFIEPVAHVLAALSPVLFLSIYVIRQLPQIPWRRMWGHFSGGLWVSPMIALLLELLTAVPLLVLIFAYVWTEIDPRELIGPLTTPSGLNDSYLQSQLQSVLNQPLLIIFAVAYVTILVPILEEMVKTIALWPVLRRRLKPLYAFVGGVVAGGAYGLFEAFFLAQPGDEWAAMMIARAGATSMHMITTGLVSMGIALGFKDQEWRRSLRYYLVAVLLHGSWNLFALGMGIGILFLEPGINPVGEPAVTAIVTTSVIVLALLTAGALWGLHTIPRRLLKAQIAQDASAGVS